MTLRDDWDEAALDAGFDPELVMLVAVPSGDYGAAYYPPGIWPLLGDTSFAFEDEHRTLLYEHRADRVVVIGDGDEGPLRRLRFRHEAQHVLQDLRHPGIGNVSVRVRAALPSDTFYPVMPHERDADAASTEFAIRNGLQGEAAIEDVDASARFLYAAPWAPPDESTLPIRLLAFTVLLDRFDVVCANPQFLQAADPAQLLDALVLNGAHLRDAVVHDRGAIERIAAKVGHTQEEWDQLSKDERARILDPLRHELVDEEQQIVEKLHDLARVDD